MEVRVNDLKRMGGASMTSAPRLNDELIDWAQRAGYALTPEDDSGAALFWTDPGGETRLFIRASDTRATLTSVDRNEDEVFVLAAAQVEVVEDYLWDFFGSDVRAKLGLPGLKVPTREEQLRAGFVIEHRADGLAHLLEIDRGDVAQARDGSIGVMKLDVLSHLVGQGLDTIRRSYESPDGRPLFPQETYG